jgi:hypothetical protein
MAGFEVSIYGRFWVSTEADEVLRNMERESISRRPHMRA